MKLWTVASLSLVILGFCDVKVEGVEVASDLKLTNDQKKVMDKFKRIMIPKLPHKYMQQEIFLVRWLRARNFDLKKAEHFLLQNLKWRKQEKMDSIHLEDWSDIQKDFPYYIDGFDKHGQPIVTAISREWDIRNAVVYVGFWQGAFYTITGRIHRVLRYLDKAMDEATGIIRQLQLSGKNVTQFVFIMHLGNFNLYQHGCPRCITSILEFVDSYEKHFPGMADKILLVQTPPVFDTIAKLVREAQSPLTREAMKIYPTDPNIWKKVLLEFIDPDQLTTEFGGTKPEHRSAI